MSLTLRYPPDRQPSAAIAAAKLSQMQVKLVPYNAKEGGIISKLMFPDKAELVGDSTILRYFGRASSLENFYGATALLASQVDEWLEYVPILSDEERWEQSCAFVDEFLSVRTFLVGYDLTIADVALWTALKDTGLRWSATLDSSPSLYPHLARWFRTTLGAYPALLEPPRSEAAARQKGPQASSAGRRAERAEKAEGPAEIELPGAVQGQVVTRFPPEPSGFLHIGHAKAALMNQYFAEKYGGKLVVRFDDTNPSKEREEFVENILEDLETLGVRGERVTFTSDYFEELQAMAARLIAEGKAYVDDTPLEAMREERLRCQESRCRAQSVAQNQALWAEMLQGSERGLRCCLRGRLDMAHANGTLRDPVYFRCNVATPHHRTGTRHRAYPTYDFACPYVDAREGITHALRSSEYHDRNEQYRRVQADMGVRHVELYDFSRLNFQYTLLSKRKLAWFVEKGRVEGWSDPRFPTVQGMVRRGLAVEALRQFILSQGASKNLNLMEWDKLWTLNKKLVDPTCARHTAVLAEGRVRLTLSNVEGSSVAVLPRHKKHPPAGLKATRYGPQIWLDQADAQAVSEGEEVTLMDWGNAVVTRVHLGEGGLVEAMEGSLHLEGSVKSTKLKLTWLADSPELVPVTLVDFDYLITKKKLDEEDDFTQVLNERTRWETAAVADSNVRNLKRGEVIQLERKGYFICDVPFVRSTKSVVLFAIPDGRQRAPPPEAGKKM